MGYGDGTDYCDVLAPDGWVTNNNDIEPTCTTNDTDVCEICGGPGLLISCLDADGDELGTSNDETLSCSVPTGYVEDCTDVNDECFTNIIDECDICDGDGYENDCLNTNDCMNMDCAGICGGEAMVETYYYDADGDGLGSEIAFYYYLNNLGKECRIINASPLPEVYECIDPDELIETCLVR